MSRSTTRDGPRSSATSSRRCDACPTARSSRTPTSRDSPATRARSGPREPCAHATAFRSSSRVTGSFPPTGSGHIRASASTTSDECSRSKVSLSEDLRNELAAIAPRSECDRLAELSGLFHSAGSVHLRGRGEVSVHLDVAHSAVARRAFGLLRGFGVGSEIRTYQRRAFDGGTRYQLHVAGDERALQVLHEAGVLSARLTPLSTPPRRIVARACCRGAYLRGALLGGGSLSGPRSPHLEARSTGLEGARTIAAAAAAGGVELEVVERRAYAIAYAKRGGAVEIGRA